jgi:hypothetical protein
VRKIEKKMYRSFRTYANALHRSAVFNAPASSS